MSHPVSGIIVALNERRSITAAIVSLLGYCDECVVVDTGSTDGTQEIVRFLAKCHSRIKFFLGTKIINRYDWNESEVRNHAATLCAHDWLLSLDGDEILDDVPGDHFRKLDHPVLFKEINLLNRREMILKVEGIPNAWYPDLHVRFYNRKQGHWINAMHAGLVDLHGKPLASAAPISDCEVWHYHGVVKEDRQMDDPETRKKLKIQPVPKAEPKAAALIEPLTVAITAWPGC